MDIGYFAPLELKIEVCLVIHRALPCAIYHAPLGLGEFDRETKRGAWDGDGIGGQQERL